jgi:hypothetical protein
MIAAVTTFVGFFAYFLMARLGTRKYMKWHVKPLVYVRIVGSALIMYIAIALVKLAMHGGKTLIHLGLYVIFGVIVYAVAIIASGEVKNELAVVMNKIKK